MLKFLPDFREPIIQRSEFSWLREKPDALVWGDMFDTPAFNIGICAIYIFFDISMKCWRNQLAVGHAHLRAFLLSRHFGV